MSDAAADAAPKSEQEILSTYRRMQSEMQGLIQHLTKIEMERNEHRYVVYECIVFFSVMMRIVARYLGTFAKIIVTGGIRVLDFILELIRGMGHWKWVIVGPSNLISRWVEKCN